MRTFIVRAIPIASIALFILIMNSDNFLKKSWNNHDNLPLQVEYIRNDLDEDQWDQANKDVIQLEKAWKTILIRVEYSAEKDEINAINVSIARLKGALHGQSKTEAYIELYEIHEHWDNIGN